ncbi:hypothetical protein V202x_38170 [Gimesia aquarii]|uniref:Uncharacterized protein n=1 Tax=Gimesia aquarii TaxID=2527964 RepID=A0A517WYU6_9PLAN|nr:hypothetical protein V202x_38170 [Gimesia aquarii]
MQLELCDDSSDKSIGVYVFYHNFSRVIEDEDVQNGVCVIRFGEQHQNFNSYSDLPEMA